MPNKTLKAERSASVVAFVCVHQSRPFTGPLGTQPVIRINPMRKAKSAAHFVEPFIHHINISTRPRIGTHTPIQKSPQLLFTHFVLRLRRA